METGSFMKLPEDRKAQILQIATEEFVRCGFDGASTNTITRRAEISKGILFHYFGSKKELYLYLLKEVVERFASACEAQTNEITGTSLYDNMAILFRSKAAYLSQYPLDLELMERSHQEKSADIRTEIHQTLIGLASTLQRQRMELMKRTVDRSRLRGGITEAQALDCIMLSLDALNARFAMLYKVKGMELFTKPELILDTMRLYLDVVCRGLFTGEQENGV